MSKIVLGLDPGPEKSALVEWDGSRVLSGTVFDTNDAIMERIKSIWYESNYKPVRPMLVIEKIESYGMGVGEETFETVYFSGRVAQAYGVDRVFRLGRKAVKIHLCNSARATDSNIRYAILDRFGGKDKAVGKKSSPGPLFGVTGHLMSALAVAITHFDSVELVK